MRQLKQIRKHVDMLAEKFNEVVRDHLRTFYLYAIYNITEGLDEGDRAEVIKHLCGRITEDKQTPPKVER